MQTLPVPTNNPLSQDEACLAEHPVLRFCIFWGKKSRIFRKQRCA